jgi:hypothetical protein
MAGEAALLDACALVPITLTDTLLRTARRGLYRPLWSRDVLDETAAAISRVSPGADPAGVARRLRAMLTAFPGATVGGYEPRIADVVLPDRGDRHVVAAALHGGAQVVVTFNLKDFPDAGLAPLGLRAVSPDAFLLDLLDAAPAVVRDVLREQAAGTRRPPLDVPTLLDGLARSGVPKFATAARDRGR